MKIDIEGHFFLVVMKQHTQKNIPSTSAWYWLWLESTYEGADCLPGKAVLMVGGLGSFSLSWFDAGPMPGIKESCSLTLSYHSWAEERKKKKTNPKNKGS